MAERYYIAACFLANDGDEVLTVTTTVDELDLEDTIARLREQGASSVDVWEAEPVQGSLFDG